jgi:hypothetical protein
MHPLFAPHVTDRGVSFRLGLLLCSTVVLGGCGRSSLLPVDCILSVAPTSLDFGEVVPGSPVTHEVTLDNGGGGWCRLDHVGLSASSDDGFAVTPSPSLIIGPGEQATLAVSFDPKGAKLPLSRSGTMQFDSNDREHAHVDIPLTAKIKSNCVVAVTPPAVDFGLVALGLSLTRAVTVTDVGIGACELTGIVIGSGSDDEFTIAVGQPSVVDIAPGGSAQIEVTFSAMQVKPPHHRTGTLVFASTDPNAPSTTVPLSADIDVGCDLTITPPQLDFGNVILNTTVTAPVTLGNDGTAPCKVSAIRLRSDSDPLFSIASTATNFTVDVGGSMAISIRFSASDSQPPHLRTGTLLFNTGNTRMPSGIVPLTAYINTKCVEASRWIYTVDQSGMFSRFDPATLTFTNIATLACPTSSTPNSMAVDQNAVAWVAYADGNMFQVDTGTAACQATGFVPNQDGILEFGMGFVFSPTTGQDTLYIAGGASTAITSSTLATISFPALTVSPVGPVEGLPELSGLGDGTLWGFIPSFVAQSGNTSLIQIDPLTGKTLKTFTYPQLNSAGTSWAMKFWGGSFWIFLGSTVYQVPRNTPDVITLAIANSGHNVVGAGVSTCAPLQ